MLRHSPSVPLCSSRLTASSELHAVSPSLNRRCIPRLLKLSTRPVASPGDDDEGRALGFPTCPQGRGRVEGMPVAFGHRSRRPSKRATAHCSPVDRTPMLAGSACTRSARSMRWANSATRSAFPKSMVSSLCSRCIPRFQATMKSTICVLRELRKR